jgi:hypothetical protein
MGGNGWQDLKSLSRLLVGNGDLALRDGSRGMRAPLHALATNRPLPRFSMSRSGMVTSSR